MRKIFAFLAVALMCTANVDAQLADEVITLDLDSTVTVPAGNVTIVVFLSGSNADPMDPVSPPNGDVFIAGGNASGPQGLLASDGCGVPNLTSPTDIGFPGSNFLVAGGDAAGMPLISNHTDVTIADPGTGLSCGVADPDGDPATIDGFTADNAWAQTISVASATDIDTVIIGVAAAVEAQGLIDTTGDGVLDSPGIVDGVIPIEVFFFFGTSPTFNMDGPNETPDAAFVLDVVVGDVGCTNPIGDINLDGTVDLLDVTPFVELLTNAGFQCEADIDENGTVDLLDVTPFVELLTGG